MENNSKSHFILSKIFNFIEKETALLRTEKLKNGILKNLNILTIFLFHCHTLASINRI